MENKNKMTNFQSYQKKPYLISHDQKKSTKLLLSDTREIQELYKNKIYNIKELASVYSVALSTVRIHLGLAPPRSKSHVNYYHNNKEKHKLIGKRCWNNYKFKVMNHYTNYDIKCICCGEKQIEFLTLDHINNDGKKHRETVHNLYVWIIHNNFPSGFQVLCMNCNWAKGRDKDHICPHQRIEANRILSEETPNA